MNPATIKLAQHTITVIQQELAKMTDKQLETLFLVSAIATCASPSNSPDTVVLAVEILRRQESPVTTVAE